MQNGAIIGDGEFFYQCYNPLSKDVKANNNFDFSHEKDINE